MDENSIVGEPGNFKLSKTREFGLSSSTTSSQPSDHPFKAAKPAAPPPVQTDIPIEPAKKTSPGTARSPTTPGTKKSKKERRKSKAAGGDEGATPKATTPQTTT